MREAVVDLASQPVRNILRNPRLVGVVKDVLSNAAVSGPEARLAPYSGGNFRIVDVVGVPGMPAGTRAAEQEAVDTGSTRGIVFAGNNIGTAAAGDAAGIPRVQVGQTWTVSAWIKTSIDLAPIFGTRVHNVPNMTASVLTENSPGKAVQSVGVWTRVSHSSVYAAGNAGIGGFVGIQARLPASAPIGATMQVAGLRISLGTDTDYGDGSLPGWRWVGTADASESVGYPYTLESIAGRPLAQVVGGGASSAPLGLTAFEGRTLYAVHDVLDLAAVGLPSIAGIGPAATSTGGRIILRGNTNTGKADLEARADAVSPSAPVAIARPGVRTLGRHVLAASLNDGATSLTCMADADGVQSSAAIAAGTGQTVGAGNLLVTAATTTGDAPVFAAAYRGQHNVETQRRVLAWLARKYGAPIPAGY